MTDRAPAGWYPDARGHPVFWDGQRWIETTPVPAPRQVVGLTSGENAVHLILTVCTLGLWSPVWLIRRWAGRRVIR